MLKKYTLFLLTLTFASSSTALTKGESSDKAVPPSANPSSTALPPDAFITNNDELIVAINLRDHILLSDGMLAYSIADDIALPFEQLMFLLEFPIQLQSGGKQANGWFINEKRRFSLDLNAGKVLSDGRSFPIAATDVRIVDNELYIPSKLLSKWFPIDFEGNLRALTVNITPREKIAIDERLTRKGKKFGKTYRIRAVNPEIDTPYKAFTIPALDVNLGAGFYEKNSTSIGNYTVRAYSDLAFMNSQFSIFGTDKEVTDARITLSRRNPRGGLLGKLDASEIQLGDISSRSAPLVRGTSSGRGFRVSSRPSDYADGGERITLEGPIEPGYDLELYRNDILIDAIFSSTDTQYKFENLELFGGNNIFRLEFYGKQGQRRTEEKQYFVGSGQVKKGQLLYDVALSQAGKSVFSIKDDDTEYNDNGLSGIVQFDYGLNQNLSLTGGVTLIPTTKDEKASTYAFAGLRSQLGRFYTTADAAVDNAGGSAIGINANTEFNAMRLSAEYNHYFNRFFVKGNEGSDTYTRSESSIKADFTPKKLGKHFSVSGSLDGSLITNNKGDKNTQIKNRLTARYKRFSFSNDLRYSYSTNSEADTLSGSSRLNLSLKGLGIRLEADYDDLDSTNKINKVGAGLSYSFGNDYSSSLSYNHDYRTDSKNISANVSKDFKFAALGVTASHRQSNDALLGDDNSVFLTASFKTFTDPKTYKTDFYNKNGGGDSGIRTHVYVDSNQNNIRDLDEPPVEGAKLFGFSRKPVATNKTGEALLRGNGSGGWSDINLDVDSLSDPSWRPAKTGVAVLPRRGVVSEIDIPVIITADIEGTVYLARDNDEKTPLANIDLQVIRKDPLTGEEKVVKTTATAFDGYYSLSGIPTGEITLRVDPEQVKRLSVREDDATVSILLGKDTDLISDQDFILIRDADTIDMDITSTNEDALQ